MSYPGQKNIPGLIHKIVNEIPFCKNFLEPFAGSAAVSNFLSVLPGVVLNYFLNDLDPTVTERYDYPEPFTSNNQTALRILQLLMLRPDLSDTFVFLDPPYLPITCYNESPPYKMIMSESDHVQLIEAVLDLECNCMLIHPSCDLYDIGLKSFRRVPVRIRYHSKTSFECLYMNYAVPDRLLTYDLYGTDCWDRQRAKRKGDRWVQKLLSLPAMERAYLLDRISKLK